MRSTNQIVIAAKEFQPATEQELRYCILALSAMNYFAVHAMDELVGQVLNEKPTAKMRAEFWKRDAETRFKSKKMPLDEYLGPGNTPGTDEYESRLKMSKAIFKKATGVDL